MEASSVTGTDEQWLIELAERFERQSATMNPRAPLYAAICSHLARDRDLRSLLLAAPPTQRLPVLLLAAIHAEVLAHRGAPLAQWYATVTSRPRPPDDALASALRSFAAVHSERIAEHCRRRATQTNEVGRSALFVPIIGQIAAEQGPIAHLDVGTSAGLNLLWPRFRYRYEPGGTVGGPSPVEMACGTRGDVPVPGATPEVATVEGIDREPIDLSDPDQVRWLQACVWPGQLDRFARLSAAIELAAAEPPVVRAGDAVADLPDAVAAMRARGHPVVTNSWVLNYLTAQQRADYLDALEREGSVADLTWIFLEAPALVSELPVEALLGDPELRDHSVLTVVRWRGGRRHVDHVARCHPHGYWMHWLPADRGRAPRDAPGR